MRALLFNGKKWLETNFRNKSFEEKYAVIEHIIASERLTDIYKDTLLNYIFSIDAVHYKDSVLPPAPPSRYATTLDYLTSLHTAYIKKPSELPYIEKFITQMKNKYALGAPPGAAARDAFYKSIESQLVFVIEYFRIEISKATQNGQKSLQDAARIDPTTKNLLTDLESFFKKIATASGKCGTAFQNLARSFYTKYILKQTYTLRRRFLYDLADYRVTIVQQGLPDSTQSEHAFSGVLHQLGDALGLPGCVEAKKFPDYYAKGHEEEIDHAHFYFTKNYTPAAIINFICNALHDNNYNEPFNKFLKTFTSEEMKLLEDHIHKMLLEKARIILSDTTKTNAKKGEEVRDLLSGKPWFFSCDDSDDLTTTVGIKNVLMREDTGARLRYALSRKFISEEDNIFEYTWPIVSLVLKSMNILKIILKTAVDRRL